MSEPHDLAAGEEPETGTGLEPQPRDIEAPEADAWEQATPARPAEQPAVPSTGDVSEWDAVEQSRIVELDDEQ